MLILSRKPGEAILIGNDIEVRVLAVNGDRVKVGVTCPQEQRIMRDELVRRALNEGTLSETEAVLDALDNHG